MYLRIAEKHVNSIQHIISHHLDYHGMLELMSDVDMYQFIEKGMRGEISFIANRHGEANNKYMNNYNENQPSKYITYLDGNNLYGWAMSQ